MIEGGIGSSITKIREAVEAVERQQALWSARSQSSCLCVYLDSDRNGVSSFRGDRVASAFLRFLLMSKDDRNSA